MVQTSVVTTMRALRTSAGSKKTVFCGFCSILRFPPIAHLFRLVCLLVSGDAVCAWRFSVFLCVEFAKALLSVSMY